jgi:hypothetical protein
MNDLNKNKRKKINTTISAYKVIIKVQIIG